MGTEKDAYIQSIGEHINDVQSDEFAAMEDKEKAFELGQRHFELAEKHHREAIILYRLSAEQGDENARNKLKKLLR